MGSSIFRSLSLPSLLSSDRDIVKYYSHNISVLSKRATTAHVAEAQF